MITLLGKLVAKQSEYGGYVTYVFLNKEIKSEFDKYVMCTKYPNWDSPIIKVGDEGYYTIEEHIAGEDKWFDGQDKNNYKFTHIQFIKFVPKPIDNLDNTITL